MMWKALVAAVLAALLLASPSDAQERRTLGFGRLFTNDHFGDGNDRWRSASYTLSLLRGPAWNGSLPDRPFEVMEYRIGTAIIAPTSLRTPADPDRRYAGTLSFLAQTHFRSGGFETSLGAGVAAVGPGTGVGEMHRLLHRMLSAPRPTILGDQLGNALVPFVTAELGRPMEIGRVGLRPFVEARAGDEDLLRVGLDLDFGARETGALWLRDDGTGQRYVGISGTSARGFSFQLGADLARVWGSAWLPDGGVEAEPWRQRLRAGVAWHGSRFGAFYGVTWLSPEFAGQPEGQILGSIRFRMNF